MITYNKLHNKKFIFKTIVLVSILIFCFFYSFFSVEKMNTENNISYISTFTKENVNIIIDPGHGGFDSGANASDKTQEKDINLEIALKLKDIFSSNGFNVIMTRDDDISIEDKYTNFSKKKSDMYNRLKILNSNSNNIFISIHQNAYSNKSIKGTQVFYSKNNPLSKVLADNIKKSITNNLQPENKRETVEAKKNLYLLYKAQVPSVLVECGFLTNNEELKMLKNDEYQKNIATTIFDGTFKFIEENKNEG